MTGISDFPTVSFFAGATGKGGWDSFVSFAPVASRDRGRGSLIFQPRREVLLQILRAGDDDDENSGEDSEGEDYEEAGEYDETDDCDS